MLFRTFKKTIGITKEVSIEIIENSVSKELEKGKAF
jgi:hypothetical protein